MNIIKYIYVLYLISVFIFISSVEDLAQDVLPLAKGNEWYYTISYYFHYPPVPPSSYKFSIIGDTVMSNGKIYWIMEPRDMFNEKYIRCDSQNVYYWQEDYNNDSNYVEKGIFDIGNTPGTTDTIEWNFQFITADESIQNGLFGKSITIYNFDLGGLLFGNISLSKEFGYTRHEYLGDSDTHDVWELTGCIISDTLYGKMTDIHSDEKNPQIFTLFQNYPNPFNPTTKIEFIIPSNSLVTLSIYNLLGQLLEVLIKKELSAGRYTIFWNASKYSSGLYFYRIESKYFTSTKKCLLVK